MIINNCLVKKFTLTFDNPEKQGKLSTIFYGLEPYIVEPSTEIKIIEVIYNFHQVNDPNFKPIIQEYRLYEGNFANLSENDL